MGNGFGARCPKRGACIHTMGVPELVDGRYRAVMLGWNEGEAMLCCKWNHPVMLCGTSGLTAPHWNGIWAYSVHPLFPWGVPVYRTEDQGINKAWVAF